MFILSFYHFERNGFHSVFHFRWKFVLTLCVRFAFLCTDRKVKMWLLLLFIYNISSNERGKKKQTTKNINPLHVPSCYIPFIHTDKRERDTTFYGTDVIWSLSFFVDIQRRFARVHVIFFFNFSRCNLVH